MENDNGGILRTIQNVRRSQWVRTVLTVLLVTSLLYTVILSALAAQGSKPFKNSKGFLNVPALASCLMPTSYYYFIWILLYIGLLFIAVYAIVVLVQKAVLGHGERQCGVLPLSFLMVLVISLNLHTGWLFAEDNLNASGSLTTSLLLFISNCIALIYTTHSFSLCGKILYRESIKDFWLGIGVVNAMAMYTTWSLVQFLQSFTVFLAYEVKMNVYKVCAGMLIMLMLLIVLWFITENLLLAYSFNTILLHYLVIVWYLSALYPRQVEKYTKTMNVLHISDLVLAVVALILRIIILYRRNKGNKIYRPRMPQTALVSPLGTAAAKRMEIFYLLFTALNCRNDTADTVF